MKKYTIAQFNEQFPTEESCLEWLRQKRWPENIECPSCEKTNKFHRVKGRKVYECAFCGHQMSPTAGTILHKSRTPLKSWFYTIFVLASTRTGVSAKQIEREIGTTYKTAWRMYTLIRKMMNETGIELFGHVEVDETYIGGKDKNRHANKKTSRRGRAADGKTIVVGLIERNGKAVAKVTPNAKKETILPMIVEHVPNSTTVIYTDEYSPYRTLPKLGYTHKVVQHAAQNYVSSEAHTNNIENFWSQVKRGIDGAHHSVSPKYLQDYVDSYLFRFNRRNDETPMFESLLDRLPSTCHSTTQ